MAITKVFRDWIPQSPYRKYNQISNQDGTVSFEDVTTYEQEGDVLNAQTLNSYTNELNTALTSTQRLTEPFQLTVETTDWTLDNVSSTYYYTYSVTGCTSDDVYIVGLVTNDDADVAEEEKVEYNKITSVETGTGAITIWASEEPELDLTISFVYGGALNG